MCGIVGVFSRDGQPAQEDIIRQMLTMIKHRGPDEFGLYIDDTISMGSARLSIIDLHSGQQPIANETNELWIVFNGEIYNYPELREELKNQGHRFTTETDTEIIISIDLPLVKKEDIEITTTEDQLIIQAKTRKTMQFKRWGTMQRELQFQSFSKGVSLPKGIEVDKIRASFQNGILEIRIPKAQKRKHIPIK